MSRPTTPSFEDDVLRLLDVQTSMRALEEEQEQIRERIRQHGPGQVGDLKVSVSPQRRFSAQLAAEKLTPEQIGQIAETTLSSAKAKDVLPPIVYESLMYEIGKPRVTVR